jgi:hypothetical protein
LAYPSTLKIVAVASNKTTLNFYHTTWHEMPDDSILQEYIQFSFFTHLRLNYLLTEVSPRIQAQLMVN